MKFIGLGPKPAPRKETLSEVVERARRDVADVHNALIAKFGARDVRMGTRPEVPPLRVVAIGELDRETAMAFVGKHMIVLALVDEEHAKDVIKAWARAGVFGKDILPTILDASPPPQPVKEVSYLRTVPEPVDHEDHVAPAIFSDAPRNTDPDANMSAPTITMSMYERLFIKEEVAPSWCLTATLSTNIEENRGRLLTFRLYGEADDRIAWVRE